MGQSLSRWQSKSRRTTHNSPFCLGDLNITTINIESLLSRLVSTSMLISAWSKNRPWMETLLLHTVFNLRYLRIPYIYWFLSLQNWRICTVFESPAVIISYVSKLEIAFKNWNYFSVVTRDTNLYIHCLDPFFRRKGRTCGLLLPFNPSLRLLVLKTQAQKNTNSDAYQGKLAQLQALERDLQAKTMSTAEQIKQSEQNLIAHEKAIQQQQQVCSVTLYTAPVVHNELVPHTYAPSNGTGVINLHLKQNCNLWSVHAQTQWSSI